MLPGKFTGRELSPKVKEIEPYFIGPRSACHKSFRQIIPPNFYEHNSLWSPGKNLPHSGFQQNVRLEILKLAPQEQNLGQPRF